MQETLHNGPRQPEIRSKFAYYSSILSNLMSYGTTIVPVFFLNIYYDTITNERNNNWDTNTRKNNLSKINLCYNLGGLVGIFVAFLLTKYNPRVVLNISRFIISACCVSLAVPDITTIMISRFFSNLFAIVSQIAVIWIVYEFYLVRDQAKIMVAIALSIPLNNLLMSVSSKFDSGDKWYWKQVLGYMPLMLMMGIVIDIFCTGSLNSVTYLLRERGRETTVEELSKIFSEEYTENLVKKFEIQLKNEQKDRRKLEERGVSQWAMDSMVYKSSLINLLVISFLGAMGFQIQYMSNGLLIGSKELSDTVATQNTKTAMTAETMVELTSYVVALFFNLTKKRKRTLMLALFFASLVLSCTSIGYLIQDLRIVRLGIALLGVSFAFNLPSIHMYTNDLVPQSLVPIQSVCCVSVNMIADALFPLVFNFENSEYTTIGLKFGFLVLVAVVSLGAMYFLMIETDGMTRDQIRLRLKNRGAGRPEIKFEEGNGFVELENSSTRKDVESELKQD